MDSWDDDNFEPTVVSSSVTTANKWEGEDEDENVKESWEDEEEEQKPESVEEAVKVPTKPKKRSLAEIAAEKERKKREEYERRLKEQQEEEISPEERLRRQKESDLKLALETTFGGDQNSQGTTGLDAFNPTTEEEFQEFADALSKKIQPLAKSTEYPAFAENLVRSLCATLTSHDIKKIKTTIDNLYLEKQKIEKGDKAKKNKGKGKAKIKVEDDNQYSAYVDVYNDDFDDFM